MIPAEHQRNMISGASTDKAVAHLRECLFLTNNHLVPEDDRHLAAQKTKYAVQYHIPLLDLDRLEELLVR
jgi:hypothetical protein